MDRFNDWEYPEIEEGRPAKYNWMVQYKDNLSLGYKTDIGAFTYINEKLREAWDRDRASGCLPPERLAKPA